MAGRKKAGGSPGNSKPTGKPSDDPSGKKKTRREGVRQPHGGMLIPGAGGGPQPGSGRPRSAIRLDLLNSFDSKRTFLDQVVAGELVTHLQVPLLNILPHVQCSGKVEDGKCVGKIVPKDPADLLLVNFRAAASANVSDRLKALDTQAKYSLGALKGILEDKVEENVRKTLDVLKERLAPDQFELVKVELRGIWAGV